MVLTPCLEQDQTTVPSDFATLQKLSIAELQLKTEAHKKAWGLDKILSWDFNQGSGQLEFSLPDVQITKSSAPVRPFSYLGV